MDMLKSVMLSVWAILSAVQSSERVQMFSASSLKDALGPNQQVAV